MVHFANYLFLFGSLVFISGLVLGISRYFEKRRRKTAKFRNNFSYHFQHKFLPSKSFRAAPAAADHRPQFAVLLRLRTVGMSTPRVEVGGKSPAISNSSSPRKN
ncbi:MAG: hypothetical protein ABSF28_27105 [Terracidiphilus sp.]|jgi:hypothetical protein